MEVINGSLVRCVCHSLVKCCRGHCKVNWTELNYWKKTSHIILVNTGNFSKRSIKARTFCGISEAMFHRLQTVPLVPRKTPRHPQLLWYRCPVDFCIPLSFSQTDCYLHSALRHCYKLLIFPAVLKVEKFCFFIGSQRLTFQLFFHPLFYKSTE